MASKPVDKLAASIEGLLSEFAEGVKDSMQSAMQELARTGVNALKAESRRATKGKRYPTGWTATETGNRVYPTVTLHNAKLPGLPHLLEYGHATRNGGRVPGCEHIKPVEDMLLDAAAKIVEANL